MIAMLKAIGTIRGSKDTPDIESVTIAMSTKSAVLSPRIRTRKNPGRRPGGSRILPIPHLLNDATSAPIPSASGATITIDAPRPSAKRGVATTMLDTNTTNNVAKKEAVSRAESECITPLTPRMSN